MNLRAAWLGLPLLLAADAALAQYQPLRYEDDAGAERLRIGGDLRLRYEHTGNPRYGLDRQDRWGVLMLRASVFADLHLGSHLRGFAQLSGSTTNGRAAGPSPVDENRLDPTNLFLEWHSARDGQGSAGLRAGIQELQFGSGRAIDAREGPNVRRSFDAVRAWTASGAWRIDAFAAAPRLNRQGSFDDARSPTQALRGIYATHNGGPSSWDLYMLHFEDSAARFVQGQAHERRWSAGARLFGRREAWDWNWEFAVQGGRFGAAGIRAWSLATDTGYVFDGVAGRPRVALLLAVASGDKDPDDDRLGTLNPFYPRGNYFGDEATLGPRNFFNIHPALTLRPLPGVQLNASLDFFWRHSTRDGVYAPNGMLIRTAGDSSARYVATIASLGATWTLAPGWTASTVAAYARPGAFLRETGAGDPLSFVSLGAQYRF